MIDSDLFYIYIYMYVYVCMCIYIPIVCMFVWTSMFLKMLTCSFVVSLRCSSSHPIRRVTTDISLF